MGTILEWLIFFAIIAVMLLGIFAQVWEESAEIAREEQREQDWREVNYWKQKSQHPMVFIKELDGEEFVLRRR